jgi:drug/metabolite transporter (DMT)-like permease
MWLLYAVIHMFLMAMVNYLDEWLTHSSSTNASASLHERIGGVLIMSTLMCAIGLSTLYIFGGDVLLSGDSSKLALISAIPVVATWTGYFYLFQIYSAHQVVPLFGLSSIWLLLIELASGSSITPIALIGIITLIVGAYLLDNGSLKWKIPSGLFFSMVFVSLCWGVAVFVVKLATESNNPLPVFFWQMVGILAIGILLFALVKPYRRGFINRIRVERTKFIGPSLMNESCSQLSFMFATFSVAAAPLAVYFTASGGIQSIFLLTLFWLFPLNTRNSVSTAQWLGVVSIALGIAMLEFGK